MKLISSSTSPYAQKVRVTALEKGVELTVENVLPLADSALEVIQNPLGKVPTLILENGELLYDSVVICAYLDSLQTKPVLLPSSGPEQFAVQRAQALGDGIMDCAFSMVMEKKREDAQPSQFWLDRWQLAIERSIAEMDSQLVHIQDRLDLGTITYACALNYVNFRLSSIRWREKFPRLNDWHRHITQRESFEKTALG